MNENTDRVATEILMPLDEARYGARYRDDLITLYRDYVASADSVSARRTAANSFFVTINTALLGIRGYFDVKSDETVIILAVVGILLSLVWYRMIESYRALNGSKFRVIQLMERQLPLAAYTAEEYVQDHGPKVHQGLSSVEAYVPMLFALLHVAIAVYHFAGG